MFLSNNIRLWDFFLTNRFHVAVNLFSNTSQMVSKCGKNKKVAHEAIAECATDVLTTFWRPLWSIYWLQNRRRATWNLFVLYNKETYYFSFFYFKILKAQKPFDVICHLYKMKQSHWSLCMARNCDWSRKIMPLSNLTQMVSRGMKTYSESRKELRNLQILHKILEKSSQFLSSEQPSV